MKSHIANAIGSVLANAILLLIATVACADTFVFDFATSFDGWQQQWHKDSPPPGTDGVVSHSTERGYLDGASLKFDMGDGHGDDGTLWIEKTFAVSTVRPTRVAVEFQLFNLFESIVSFEVKATIRPDNPDKQADFKTIGVTDTAVGWVPFVFEETLSSPTGQAWVALGVRVAWETHRDYWIDHVVVSTSAIPGDYNFDGTVDAADYVVWRKTDGTPAGYTLWRSHFGQTAGSGSDANSNAAIPEPTTLVLLMFAAACMSFGRRGKELVSKTRLTLRHANNPPIVDTSCVCFHPLRTLHLLGQQLANRVERPVIRNRGLCRASPHKVNRVIVSGFISVSSWHEVV